MVRKKYIPGGIAEFLTWEHQMYKYVVAKTSGSNPAWTHISTAALENIGGQIEALDAASDTVVKIPTPANRHERRRLHRKTEKACRVFVNQYLRFPPVTDTDRDIMGVHNHSSTRTTIGQPATVPLITKLTSMTGQLVLVHFHDDGEVRSQAIPYGFSGCILNYTWGPEKVTDTRFIKEYTLMTASPFMLTELPSGSQGQWLSCCPQWMNRKGKKGKKGDVEYTVIL
jgi:hypothetical protein